MTSLIAVICRPAACSDLTCGNGRVCVDGECRLGQCNNERTCPAGQTCDDGLCMDLEVGLDDCVFDEDCGDTGTGVPARSMAKRDGAPGWPPASPGGGY